MKILLLTPIELEFSEARKYLSSTQSILSCGINYEVGNYKGLHHDIDIILKQTGSKTNEIALATERAIQKFKPEIVLLVGIAGGVKDVSIGDIVIATKLSCYESGKETENGFVYRADSIYCSPDLVSLTQNIGRSDSWKNRSIHADSCKVFWGPIASGNKVIGTSKSIIYEQIKTHLNSTLALEMEAIGFGKSLLHYPLIKFVNIRGISDLLDNKSGTDKEGGQDIAVSNVMAFTFEVLYQLDYSKLNIPKEIMEMKTFANKIYKKMLPWIQQEAGQKVELPNDSYLPILLEKVKPIVKEDYDEIINNYKDDFAHSDFRNSLKKALEKNDQLAKELKVLLDQSKQSRKENKTEIKNSKNVISGSKIKVGGNFHLGDKKK